MWTEQLEELALRAQRQYGLEWHVVNSNGAGPARYDLSQHPIIKELINELYKAHNVPE